LLLILRENRIHALKSKTDKNCIRGYARTPAHGADDENSLVGSRAFAQLGEGNSKSPGVGAPDKQKLETVMIDEGRLNQLIGQMICDLGGASSVAMVRIGDARSGCMQALARQWRDDGGGTRFRGGCA
jgi:hypothetical protein